MTKLTKEIILYHIEKIKKHSLEEDQIAHLAEDNLYRWFVKCISKNTYTEEETIELATLIESTSSIDFGRWCA